MPCGSVNQNAGKFTQNVHHPGNALRPMHDGGKRVLFCAQVKYLATFYSLLAFFLAPTGLGKIRPQLVKYCPVLSAKPSNKMYIVT